jgi:hypothetical protein
MECCQCCEIDWFLSSVVGVAVAIIVIGLIFFITGWIVRKGW